MSRIILSSKIPMDDFFHEANTPMEKTRNLILPKKYLSEDGSVVSISNETTLEIKNHEVHSLVHKDTSTGVAILACPITHDNHVLMAEKEAVSVSVFKEEKQEYIRRILDSRNLMENEDERFFHRGYDFVEPLVDWKRDIVAETRDTIKNLIFTSKRNFQGFHDVINNRFLVDSGDDYMDSSLLEPFIQRIIDFHLKTFVKNKLQSKVFLIHLMEILQRPDKGYFHLILKAISRRELKELFKNLEVVHEIASKEGIQIYNPSEDLKLLLKVNSGFLKNYRFCGQHKINSHLNFSC